MESQNLKNVHYLTVYYLKSLILLKCTLNMEVISRDCNGKTGILKVKKLHKPLYDGNPDAQGS